MGDYPEMRDIDPRMLGPHAIPNAPTLRLLNERLREWAKARPQYMQNNAVDTLFRFAAETYPCKR